MWYTLDRIYSESWCNTINFHDSPSFYTTWTLNLERILSMCQNQQEALTYGWDLKVVIYLYGLGHCWWKLMAICFLNRGTMLSHEIKIVCLLRCSKGHVIMKIVVVIIPLEEFGICFLELEYVSWLNNKWDLQLKNRKVNLNRW